MHLRKLELRNYRSWRELNLELAPGVTVLVGRNGFGKTNVVEAIGYLAHLSSHRVHNDAPLVHAGHTAARVSATAVNGDRELTAHLLIKAQGANKAQINRTKVGSPREILGIVKSILFAPEDLALVRGEPEQRRRYLDEVIATRSPRLAGVKADYDKVLRQRNALLRNASYALRRGYEDADGQAALTTLDAWDSRLAQLGAQVIAARLNVLSELEPHIHSSYARLAPESRPARVQYSSSVPLDDATDAALIEAGMLTELSKQRRRDIERGMSTVGPHRDDVVLLLGDHPAKGFASHGETWSYALALRLAVFFLLRSEGTDPILILDDVFAELDAQRRRKLVDIALEAEQVIITAAVGEDIPDTLNPTVHTVLTETDNDGRFSFLGDQVEASVEAQPEEGADDE